MAEPLYILLALSGLPDAHETVRQLTLERQSSGKPIGQLLRERPGLHQRLTAQLAQVGYGEDFLEHPSRYTGRSAEHAQQLALHYQQRILSLKQKISADR